CQKATRYSGFSLRSSPLIQPSWPLYMASFTSFCGADTRFHTVPGPPISPWIRCARDQLLWSTRLQPLGSDAGARYPVVHKGIPYADSAFVPVPPLLICGLNPPGTPAALYAFSFCSESLNAFVLHFTSDARPWRRFLGMYSINHVFLSCSSLTGGPVTSPICRFTSFTSEKNKIAPS